MKLNNQDIRPLYRQLKDEILSSIDQGVYPRGSRIPTEMELGDLYEVSRITVRKALKELSDEKILERRQGKGTFVSSVKLQRSIINFMGFSEICAAQGLEAGYKVIKLVIADADKEDQEALNLSEGDRVIVLERILFADQVPVCIGINRFTEDYSFLLEESLDTSLFELLNNKYGIRFQNQYKMLELIFANYEMSKYLKIPMKYPLLQISGTVTNQDGTKAFHDTQYIVGDKFKFYI